MTCQPTRRAALAFLASTFAAAPAAFAQDAASTGSGQAWPAKAVRIIVDFADAIAAGAYPIDIHPAAGGGLVYAALGADHAYQIPYRSLLPAGLDNALVAGRGVSATHQALAAIRVMTISMAVGQAAGTAAALAARAAGDANTRAVKVDALRSALLKDGACLA